ncbi:MAG: nitrate reductase molybdenum cofactor assembly chaperone [Terriglobales bacterium]
MNRDTYDALAGLLTYPAPNFRQQMALWIGVLPPAVGSAVVQFAAEVSDFSLEQVQELFTQTFDLNPLCSLELGWHLFGENYERGLLLVRMREELRRAGVEESAELPDHMTHALRLLGRMDHERAVDFAAAILLPALMKMLESMRGKNTPYEHVLRALAAALRADFPEIPLPQTKAELPVLSHEVSV